MKCSRCKKRPAVVFITRAENDRTVNEGFCLVCARELGIKPVDDLIRQLGVSSEDLEQMSEMMESVLPDGGEDTEDGEDAGNGENAGEDGSFSPGGASTSGFLEKLFGAKAGDTAASDGAPDKKEKRSRKRRFLNQYCTDLTAKARRGEIDTVVGRDREVYRVTQILSRRTKNNPCLIGEPGVGKTAIAEALAIRIAAGAVPPRLMDKEIHLLDLTALVAGTQFRGQFESRIKGLVDEVKAEGNIILFIDEVHNLVGTGDAEGSMSAANILKPALSRGQIQVIGATTFNEYRKHIEKDSALERRFQPVTVEEPTIEQTVDILRGIKGYYENFHGVRLADNLLTRAVQLAERYITDRFLPDKAIDLLDEACAAAALKNQAATDYDRLMREIADLRRQETEAAEGVDGTPDYERLATVRAQLAKCEQEAEELRPPATEAPVTGDDLAQVIELWTGIPAAKIRENELTRLQHLEEHLRAKIIGQDEAVATVAAAIRRSRVQISTRRHPASFIFVGSTGVGKTELVKVLASELFDTPETLIRLDMSEYMEKHAVSRIVGSPPGYVGYDEAGQLTEKVRRKPYSVILFDEIEKAHPDVMNILLQILDEGRITDAHGRTVNFENTVIVMTSNAGSQFRDNLIGFGNTSAQAVKEKVLKALGEFLRPEFLGRVDEVVFFRPLDREAYAKIAALMLGELVAPLADRGITFGWSDDVPGVLADRAYGGKRGARDLRGIVRREVEDRIAALLVERADTPPSALTLMLDASGALCLTEP